MKDLILFGVTTAVSILLSKRTSPKDGISSFDMAWRKSLEEGTSLDARERVCTVDENNNPTPTGHTRAEMRLNNLWHRATYIVVRYDPDNTGIPSHQVRRFHMMAAISAEKTTTSVTYSGFASFAMVFATP